MINRIIIKNSSIVNKGKIERTDLLIEDILIQWIGPITSIDNTTIVDGTDKYLLPGIIYGQAHFRNPGPTHKGNLYTESKAAIAGGVTPFIDMPNTVPNDLTLEILN